MTAPQAQLSTELVRPVRQMLLVDAHQRRCVVHHGRHPRLHQRAAQNLHSLGQTLKQLVEQYQV